MCGIVGAVSTRNIVPVLVQGLERLEYRGYDSCGVAVYAHDAEYAGLRRALDHGVRVVVAHCATLGEDRDEDRLHGGKVASFDLFARLIG